MKIGVFICWCGENIARTVDCEKVAEEIGKLNGVHCSVSYKYVFRTRTTIDLAKD
jgi:heterodisulfide reductase subunit A